MAEDEMTLPEAARALGLNPRTLQYAAIHPKESPALKARRIGPLWVTTLAAVQEWLAGASHRPGHSPRLAGRDGG